MTAKAEFYQTRLLGETVYIAGTIPGYQLPPDRELSLPPAFRRQFEEWAASFFKQKEIIPDGQVVGFNGHLAMNRKTYDRLVTELADEKIGVPSLPSRLDINGSVKRALKSIYEQDAVVRIYKAQRMTDREAATRMVR